MDVKASREMTRIRILDLKENSSHKNTKLHELICSLRNHIERVLI